MQLHTIIFLRGCWAPCLLPMGKSMASKFMFSALALEMLPLRINYISAAWILGLFSFAP